MTWIEELNGYDININTSVAEAFSKIDHVVCKDIHGVTWVDDSKATNTEATYAGLLALTRKSVVLLGGLAKVRYLFSSECTFLFMTD